MPLARWSSVLSFVCLASCCLGQIAPSTPTSTTPATTGAPAQTEMPSDPAALLELAAKKNGLRNFGSAPWHLKATYEVLDHGVAQETGSFEEFWVSEKKLKIIYASRGFKQTLYSTNAGGFRAGDQSWPSGAVLAARNSLFPFFPSSELLKNSKLDLTDKPVGQSQLKCVTVDTSGQTPVGNSEVYCFSPNAPVLRLFEMSRGASQCVYNGIVSFRGIYLARDILVSAQGKPGVRVHVESIEGIPEIDESIFIPPADAVPVKNGKIDINAGVMAGRILRKVAPEYPEALKSVHLEGIVVLQATIKKDGTVSDLNAISGPKPLYPAAEHAVSQWIYEPYLLDGEPVEVGTTINIIFGSPPK